MNGSIGGASQLVYDVFNGKKKIKKRCMKMRKQERKQEERMARTQSHLLRRNMPLRRLPKILNNRRVASETLPATDEDDGKTGTEVPYFWNPLLNAITVSTTSHMGKGKRRMQ
jgi:hypothetical protein